MEPSYFLLASALGTLIGGGGILWAQRRVIQGGLIPKTSHDAQISTVEAAWRADIADHNRQLEALQQQTAARIQEAKDQATARIADRDERLNAMAIQLGQLWEALRDTEVAYDRVVNAERHSTQSAMRALAEQLAGGRLAINPRREPTVEGNDDPGART